MFRLRRILYHSRIHPACPVPALSDQNIIDLHHNIREIPLTAVEVDADSRQFPEDWLFRWRWGKGKKQTAGSKKSRVKDEEKVKDEAEESGEDIKPAGKDFLSLVSISGPGKMYQQLMDCSRMESPRRLGSSRLVGERRQLWRSCRKCRKAWRSRQKSAKVGKEAEVKRERAATMAR